MDINSSARAGRPTLQRCVGLLLITLFAAMNLAHAAEHITVESTSGSVKVRSDNSWYTPQVGMYVVLPAVISTGSDGNMRLRQGEIAISIAANSAIELKAGADGELVQEVMQEAGSAFYDIAPQKSRRFRVQSPYLVAVVKGTQFNVTVSEDRSSVALFEGHLQIDAPDIGASISIDAGQIATRRRGDPVITVVDMSTGKVLSDPIVALLESDGDRLDVGNSAGDVAVSRGTIVTAVSAGMVSAGVAANTDLSVGSLQTSANTSIEVGNEKVAASLGAGLETGVAAATGLESGVDAVADLGAGAVTIAADVGDIDLDLNLAPDIGDDLIDIDANSGGTETESIIADEDGSGGVVSPHIDELLGL